MQKLDKEGKLKRGEQRIKLLIVIDFIYGLKGGTENQLLKLIDNLDRNKFIIKLISLRNTDWIEENKKDIGCEIKTFNIKKIKNPAILLNIFLIISYMIKIKPDIVITFFPLSNIIGIISAYLANVKIKISTRRDYGLWINKWTKIIHRINKLIVDGIITNSKIVAELVAKEECVNKSKISVIYNGVNIQKKIATDRDKFEIRTKIGIKNNEKVVGIVGGLKPMKRHQTFIKAAREILRERDDIHFIIVGDGPLREELENLTKNYKICKNMHFVGSQENVDKFLSIFDIAVNCSANEGLSNAIMEYMIYGIPVIVTRAGGNTELIENNINGLTFELDDYLELSKLILNILKDNEKMEIFSRRSIKRIIKYSVKNMVENYENYFLKKISN